MSDVEVKIGETIAELIPRLTEEQKERFLCFAEGMAAMADTVFTQDRGQIRDGSLSLSHYTIHRRE